MSAVLKKACSICSQAFERAYVVLNDTNVQGTFEVKAMVYRNYNSPAEQILESTAFESTPVNLKSFLNNVQASGGWGPEAIEVAMQAINKEPELDQIILIGDVMANPPDEVTTKRKNRGESYWNARGYPKTEMEQELAKFNNKCPIHTFYIRAGEYFTPLSKKTGGESDRFDVNSPRASEDLTAFIVCQILEQIERKTPNNGGNLNLVAAYKKMYS